MSEQIPKSPNPDGEVEARQEKLDQTESIPNPETQEEEELKKYQKKRISAEQELESLKRDKISNEKLSQTRESLGLSPTERVSNQAEAEIGALEMELVRAQANYPGHWTLLLAERLRHPDIRQKFVEVREETLPSMREGEPGPFDKEKKFRSHYEAQLADYNKNIDSVFSYTKIGNAAEFGKKPIHLGEGNVGELGTVFTDAEISEGEPLTTRQKSIIEAHEKGHGMRDFQGSDANEIRSVLDSNILREREESDKEGQGQRFANYLNKPEEIIERMSQLKNYFGFKGNETFTKKHLDYARENYIKDTGLDNTMSHFFAAVTSDTEDRFIEVMNKYPV